MPYADPLDATTPADTEGVSQGDDRIREFKRAVSQRLSDLVNAWPNGPLTVKAAALEAGGAGVGVDITKLSDAAKGLVAETKVITIASGTVSVPAGGIFDITVAGNFAGARPGDGVVIGHPSAIPAAVQMLVVVGFCPGNDQVTLRFLNLTAAAIVFAASQNYTLRVTKSISSWP